MSKEKEHKHEQHKAPSHKAEPSKAVYVGNPAGEPPAPKEAPKVKLELITRQECALGNGTRKAGDVIGVIQVADDTVEALADYKVQDGDEGEIRNAMLNPRLIVFSKLKDDTEQEEKATEEKDSAEEGEE